MWFFFPTLRTSVKFIDLFISSPPNARGSHSKSKRLKGIKAISFNVAVKRNMKQHQDKWRFYTTLWVRKHNAIIIYENLIKDIYNANVFIPFYLSKIMTRVIIYYAHMLCSVMLYALCIYFSFTSWETFYSYFEKLLHHIFYVETCLKAKGICRRIIYERLHSLIARREKERKLKLDPLRRTGSLNLH